MCAPPPISYLYDTGSILLLPNNRIGGTARVAMVNMVEIVVVAIVEIVLVEVVRT